MAKIKDYQFTYISINCKEYSNIYFKNIYELNYFIDSEIKFVDDRYNITLSNNNYKTTITTKTKNIVIDIINKYFLIYHIF